MGRAPCCDKARVKRGPWSPEEDEALRSYLQSHGSPGNWISLPHKAGLKRCGKSCRLRWLNYLRPHIKRGSFTQEEDDIILSLYSKIGSRWSVIAAKLPGRTDNDVKNHWNTKLKKKLLIGGDQTPKKTTANAYEAAAHNNLTSSCGSNANPNSLLNHTNNNNATTSSGQTQQQLYLPSFSYLLAQGNYNSSLITHTNALLLDQFIYSSPLDPRTEQSSLEEVGHLVSVDQPQEPPSSTILGSSPSLVKEETDSYFAYPYHGSNTVVENDLWLDQLDTGLGFEHLIPSDDPKAAFNPGYAYGVSECKNLATAR